MKIGLIVETKIGIHYIYIKMENKCLNANNISQYYCFYCISGEQTSFKNIMEFY